MLALTHHHALLELLGRRIRLRARLELGDLTGVDADIAAYARVADRLRSPTYSWLVPMWRGMRAVLDGDLDAGSRYADEVARARQDGPEPERRDDGLDTALENRAPAPRHPCDRRTASGRWRSGRRITHGGTARSRCCSPSREIPSAGDDTCTG